MEGERDGGQGRVRGPWTVNAKRGWEVTKVQEAQRGEVQGEVQPAEAAAVTVPCQQLARGRVCVVLCTCG